MSADHAFAAMGTGWWIRCDRASSAATAEALVRRLEARLSRFLPDSSLVRLNRERTVRCPDLALATTRALEVRAATDGAFDPTLGRDLAALGYDRTFDEVRSAPHRAALARSGLAVQRGPGRGPTKVVVDGDEVTLDGPGDLDLGGIGKGLAVDLVLELLRARGVRAALVDGGGDIRGFGGPWPIGVADDLAVSTSAGAIATSSILERRWTAPDGLERHHILDPRSGLPALGPFDTATVIAPDCATADALATALLVDPLAVIAHLPALGAHAVARSAPGRWWMSPGAPLLPARDADRWDAAPAAGGPA